MHDHTPVAFNLARLPRHQVSPDRPRYRAHSIFLNRDLNVLPLIPNLIHRTDDRSGAYNKFKTKRELGNKRRWVKRERIFSPEPNISTRRPDCAASQTSFIVTPRSETTSFGVKLGMRSVPAAWLRASDTIESRVTPGRIVPSSGGVTSSNVPSACLKTTKRFIVPTYYYTQLQFHKHPKREGYVRTSVRLCSGPVSQRFWT
jgi:hypothetical protein